MKLPKEFPSTGYKNHFAPILRVNSTFFLYHRKQKEEQDHRNFLTSDTSQEALPTKHEGHLNARKCLAEFLPLQSAAWSAALWRWHRHRVQLHEGALWRWSILWASGIFHQVTLQPRTCVGFSQDEFCKLKHQIQNHETTSTPVTIQ